MKITWKRHVDPFELDLNIKFAAEDLTAAFGEQGVFEALIAGLAVNVSRVVDSQGVAAQLHLKASPPEPKT